MEKYYHFNVDETKYQVIINLSKRASISARFMLLHSFSHAYILLKIIGAP